jgi:hypothetical protein
VLPDGRMLPLAPAPRLVAAVPAASAGDRGYGEHDDGAGAPLAS